MSPTTTKSVTLPMFLTDEQLAEAATLHASHVTNVVAKIQAQVIEPNLDSINARLGQENDARYLAYVVTYVLSQTLPGVPI